MPASQADSWKGLSGISVETANLKTTVKLPAPGITYHMNQASASRVPWIDSNGWRFMRQPHARFFYDVNGATAALAAAEAFCYGSSALVQTGQSGLAPLAAMLKFLAATGQTAEPEVADIGFIDDGSAIDAEVMNLLVRDNLLFRIVRAPNPNLKLTVRIGSKKYPANEAKNPDLMEHKIRANLGDERRLIRLYGTSIVVARVTGKPGKLRLHLLNYGAGKGARVAEFRVRILGRYSKVQLHSFDSPDDHVVDYSPGADATEFTIPGLKVYAVVDLSE
ncbi:MAG TPA: hypothetical protein VHZ07_11835 [Bryobacteraceae bacterium]|nr:hypothetical protein [Bryobacteraceae bacterium]